MWKCVVKGVWKEDIIFTRAGPEKEVGEGREVR